MATGLGWGDTDEQNTNRVWGFDAVGVQYAGWAFDADIGKVRSAAGTPLHVYLKLRPARLDRRQLSLPLLYAERSRVFPSAVCPGAPRRANQRLQRMAGPASTLACPSPAEPRLR